MLALLFLCANVLLGQSPGKLELNLLVMQPTGDPLANAQVEFVELNSRERIALRTNEEGRLSHVFDSGRYWQINVEEVRDYFYWQIEVRPGKYFTMERTITYDYDRYLRESRPAVDRGQLNLERVEQNYPGDLRGDAQNGMVLLKIKRPNKQALGLFNVQLTCYALGKTFSTRTNTLGEARFFVPLGQEYEIDIDGIESYQYVDMPDRPGYRATRSFTYEPTIVQEVNRNDTIRQTLAAGQEGTTGRVISTVTLRGGPEGVWKGEPVYLEVLGEKLWYAGQTDQAGEVRFLLPKGKQYMIHGRFERNLDVLDYRRRRGIGYSNKGVLYRPQDKYQFPEKYIPTPEQLITDAFTDFIEKQYPRPELGQALRTVGAFTGAINEHSKEAVLRLAFTTPETGNIAAAPPMNISFVVDKSGSMAGEERIGYLKRSLVAFGKQLRDKDRISLVSFEDFEEIRIPSTPMKQAVFQQAVESLEAGGGTNIYKGMLAGYKEVARHMSSRSINRVIILSDGYGVTPVQEILDAQKPYTEKGIGCSTVGVGEDYNYALLKLLATNGGGHISHVGDPQDMERTFLEELTSVLFPIAQHLQVEVHYPEGLAYKQLYGFPLEEKKGRVLKFTLDNAFSGLDQLALLRFRLDNPTPELCDKPVLVRLSFRNLATNQVERLEAEVKLEWEDFSGELELVMDQNEKKLFAVAVMNQSLKVMSDRFHLGDMGGARAALQDGLEQLRKVYPQVQDEDLRALESKLMEYLDIIQKQIG